MSTSILKLPILETENTSGNKYCLKLLQEAYISSRVSCGSADLRFRPRMTA
ncbi:hypothetical protein WN55_07304 [Dufourea novaeangliae]|uniref:Uncharacterized protein n=1 Tax=Dufourea novaeangliae TaxID=178035 RepID=A0A154PTE6_DUFNO|nr:hypothetical protein WN55_07304 [Dufourea novaeangliae]